MTSNVRRASYLAAVFCATYKSTPNDSNVGVEADYLGMSRQRTLAVTSAVLVLLLMVVGVMKASFADAKST